VTDAERRDLVLLSLRSQFETKVAGVTLVNHDAPLTGATLDAFLRDLANNIAQGLMDITETE